MVKHVILWKLKEEFSEIEKNEVKLEIKKGLEGLKGHIDGLVDIKVNIDGFETSTCDLMLDSTFVDFDSYKKYKTAPAHVKVADTSVRPNVSLRLCLDYEI